MSTLTSYLNTLLLMLPHLVQATEITVLSKIYHVLGFKNFLYLCSQRIMSFHYLLFYIHNQSKSVIYKYFQDLFIKVQEGNLYQLYIFQFDVIKTNYTCENQKRDESGLTFEPQHGVIEQILSFKLLKIFKYYFIIFFKTV